MKEFTNTEDMNEYILETLNKVLKDVTNDILADFQKDVINLAYINTTQSGNISDLFKRDYVDYYNHTGTPTFNFYHTFKMIKDETQNIVMNLVYDESEIKVFSNDAHTIDGTELLNFLEGGENTNIGGFIQALNDKWSGVNFSNLVQEYLNKYDIGII